MGERGWLPGVAENPQPPKAYQHCGQRLPSHLCLNVQNSQRLAATGMPDREEPPGVYCLQEKTQDTSFRQDE